MTHNTSHVFTIERTFNAPREKVFAAFTACEHLMHWWGPHQWPIFHCDIDFRVGGSWHYAMRETGGDGESWGLMLFDEIDAPAFIGYRDVFSDADRTVNTDLPETTSTLHFYDEDGKTRVVSNSMYPDAEALQQIIDMGMEQGLKETWDRLETYLAR